MAADGAYPFRYRDFYDFPRLVLVTLEDGGLLLDSPFDDEAGEYRDTYSVWWLTAEGAATLAEAEDWSTARVDSVYVGAVPVRSIDFDSSRRRSVSAASVRTLRSMIDERVD